MKFPDLKSSRALAWSTTSSFITIIAAHFCLQQDCQAQQPLASQSNESVNRQNNINWTSGPQRAPLGDIADIEIPPGYHFADVHGARIILASFNDAIPDDLLGILAPTSGKWMAILEFSPVGYVKNLDVTQINSGKVLKQILDQIGKQEQSSVASLSWQSQPVYDTASHVLEWSLLVATPSSKVLNQTAAIFGRHGVVQLTVVEHLSDTRAHSLKQLVSSVIFKPGERYADYRSGDKIADIGLAELILGDTRPQTAGVGAFNGFGPVVAWTYGGLAVCLLTGGVLAVRRKSKTLHRRSQIATPTSSPIIKNKASVNGASLEAFNRRNLAKPFHRKRRRRGFNYSKFYSKVMRELSCYTYGPPSSTHGKSSSDAHAHVHGNGKGESNGHVDVSSATHAPSPNEGASHTHTTKSEIEKLIAIQNSLIEHQKCLLAEQTRLIEEKRLLIEGQTAFLKAQSDLAAEQQQYPLKVVQ